MRLAGLVFCLTLISTVASAGRLSDVEIQARQDETIVRLVVLDAAPLPRVHMLSDNRLIVDLPGVEASVSTHLLEANTAELTRVRVGIHHEPETRTRVVFDLTGPTVYSVTFSPTGLTVSLRGAGAVSGSAKLGNQKAPAAPQGNQNPPAPRMHDPSPTAEATRFADPGSGDAPAAAPTPRHTPVPTASVAPTASASPLPTASPTPKPTAAPTPAPTASPTPAPTAASTPLPTASPTPVPTASPTPRPTAPPSPGTTARTLPIPNPEADDAQRLSSGTDSEPAPTGRPSGSQPAGPMASGTVTIDFRDAEVRTVIDLVANVGGYDVIFTPEVRGSITIRIVDRPWEEALQTILDRKRLRATRHADLILVSPDDWD